ncbi:MAG TPA: hypothetical protein VG897_05820 [Terriglobales bacterium]|nr:hypothetical protein [Terriglobales bacterium]
MGNSMASFRDALARIAARMVREHQVLHIAGELPTATGVIDHARAEILKWAQKRSGDRFPTEAIAGKSFELLAAGRNSAAVEVDLPEIYAWAFRQEDPDKVVAGRIWTTEAILWRTADRPLRFTTRLMVGSPEAQLAIEPAVPGYVRQIVQNIGMKSGERPLSSIPSFIGDEGAQEDLLDFLVAPKRRLPVIVISATDPSNPSPLIDVDKLAAGLCGLAHIAVILPQSSWAITDQFGKRLSVFDRGIRIYMPGFDHTADPYSHPLWLGNKLATAIDASLVERHLRAHVAQFSTRVVRIGSDILPFAQLRSIGRKAEQDRLASSGASKADQLIAAQERIAAIERELSEAKDMEQLAIEEAEVALLRAEEAERREYNVTMQIQNLLQQLEDNNVSPGEQKVLPTDWEEFDDWCDQALVGRVTLTGVARRGCKKAKYEDVAQAARCLLWLAKTGRDRFLNGGGSLRDEPVEDGIRNSLCGSDEFEFDWQSRRLVADWHIKTGGNTRAPENCLRIYYCWDEKVQQVIVADMPAHRRTSAS